MPLTLASLHTGFSFWHLSGMVELVKSDAKVVAQVSLRGMSSSSICCQGVLTPQGSADELH